MTVPRNFLIATLLIGGLGCYRARAVDVVVVCPQQFQATMQPWLDHRRGEGLDVCVIDSNPEGKTLRQSIRDASADNTRYVLLIGDAPVLGTPCNELCQTPILYAPTKVTSAWGSTPTLSTDLLYGDFDLDEVPDAVVGRLPVDEPKQLEKLIERIVARDNSNDFGRWRGEVQLVGGVGDFGAMVDGAIETVTRSIVTSVLPPETRTSVAYASPGHRFFPSKQTFTEAVLQRYRRGARFFVYAGHGQITHLDRVPNTLGGTPVLDQRSVQRLERPASGAPIALMLSCYTGALDASEDSIAEEMVLCDGGPIAVVAGSRVTMPYGNTTAAVGLIDGVFTKKLPRLGDAWLSALKQMHREQSNDSSQTRMMIDWLAMMISPAGTKLVDERREHMMLYNLIGDPTLRLHHPRNMVLKAPVGMERGQLMELEVESPISGRLTITVDRPLGGVNQGDPNATTISSFDGQISGGRALQANIDLPERVSGPVVVRAMVSGDKEWATAAAHTIIRTE